MYGGHNFEPSRESLLFVAGKRDSLRPRSAIETVNTWIWTCRLPYDAGAQT